MEEKTKLKERIAKLLRMAKDATSPNEAAIAASRARALMDKHQIDEYDVSERESLLVLNERPASRFFKSMPMYMQFIATAVAKYNDCHGILQRGAVDYKKKAGYPLMIGNRIMFRGFEDDTELATQMLVYLLDQIDALCKTFLTGKGYTKYPYGIGSEFKMGCAQSVILRINKLIEDRSLTTFSDGTSLVVSKMAEVEKAFGKIDYAEKSAPVKEDPEAVAARIVGWSEGDKVKILKEIGEDPEVAL